MCPASTRWDSKISRKSSAPVRLACIMGPSHRAYIGHKDTQKSEPTKKNRNRRQRCCPRLVLNSVLVVAEEAHPQKDVPRILTRVLQPPAYCTDHILQAVSPTPGDEVGDLSLDTPRNEKTLYHGHGCLKKAHGGCAFITLCKTSRQSCSKTKRPLCTSSTASTMLQWGSPSRGQVLL